MVCHAVILNIHLQNYKISIVERLMYDKINVYY